MYNRTASVALVLFVASNSRALADCQANCYLVNTAADTINPSCDVGGIGTCSLRDAITKMALSSNNVIQFAIGSGPQTITLLSDLPDILLPVTIDGTTQPGYAGVPLIQIRRGDAGTANHGLETRGPLTNTLTLKALVLSHFNGLCNLCAAIILSDPADLVRPGGHTIQGCYIGTDPTGMTADGNLYGIEDNTEGANTFGGTMAAERNVISGNATGIAIGKFLAGYSVQSVVEGNYIGTDATGTALIANTYGVMTGAPFPGFSPAIVIGGSGPGAGNVIAGNGNGIQMNEGVGNTIEGNLIGLDATGMSKLGEEVGILLEGETNASILNNFIAGTSSAAVSLSEEAVTNIPTAGTVIQGNFVGTDITGTRTVSEGGGGILIAGGAPNNTIGGPGNGQGNFIGGFSQGIQIEGTGFGSQSTGNVIQGNHIGIGLAGSPIPNSTAGIELFGPDGGTIVGGTAAGEENYIAFNGLGNPPGAIAPGVSVQFGAGNVILGNSIFQNTGKGIDFYFPANPLPYPNDIEDADSGPNTLQNFPILTGVTITPTSIRVQGTLNSVPQHGFLFEFYANPAPVHPADFLQGQAFLGVAGPPIETDLQGNAAFDVTFNLTTVSNIWISATATDVTGCPARPETNPYCGNTSEFSQRSLFSITPNHGPSTGGTPFTISGQLFQSGATVNFGVPPGGFATGVNVAGPTQITGLTPGFPPGLYSVTVTNPDLTTAVMPKAYLMDFQDVPPGSPFYPFVTSLALDGVTSGCGGVNYCPGNDVTRAQMAVFLLKAKYGPFWVPPPATGTVFSDVPAGSFAADWIEELFHEGITAGCGGGNYCPGSPVTRQQMAVFLLKAEHGSSFVPPVCAGIFGDVACPSLFADWIEQLYAEGVTGGCQASPPLYCPGNDVTRGQMAVFVVKTFKLP